MAVAYYNAGQIWATWTTGGTSTTIPVGNYQQIWNGWVTTSSTTITGTWTNTTQQYVWNTWEQDYQVAEENRFWDQQQQDELQARREQANRERLERAQKAREDREAANLRAYELLYDLLSDAEVDELAEHDYLMVTGTDGHLYRLETHRETVHGNIVRTDEHGCTLGRACVAPGMYAESGIALPTADGWVGQYLGLKFDTEEFLSHANWSQVRRCNIGFELRTVEDPHVARALQEVA